MILKVVMRKDPLNSRTIVLIVLFLQLFFPGCARLMSQPMVSPQEKESKTSSIERVNLAGSWEYQDKDVAYPLILNDEGIGEYNWKGGQFVTTTIIEDRWHGVWHQTENDREGGFALRLSADGNYAEGRWWYTRIEEDHSPTQPGGSFRLLRDTPSTTPQTDIYADPFEELGEVPNCPEC